MRSWLLGILKIKDNGALYLKLKTTFQVKDLRQLPADENYHFLTLFAPNVYFKVPLKTRYKIPLTPWGKSDTYT